jgi:hypothetical protein
MTGMEGNMEVVVQDSVPPRAGLGRSLAGMLRPLAARFEVRVIDRRSGTTLMRATFNHSRHEAIGLAAIWRDELAELGDTAFLKKHVKETRRR